MRSLTIGAMAMAIVALSIVGASGKEPAKARQLIKQWQAQNSLCRGLHGDDPRMQPACDERQRLGRLLDRQGWCYGKKDQFGYQMQWHRCTPTSLHAE